MRGGGGPAMAGGKGVAVPCQAGPEARGGACQGRHGQRAARGKGSGKGIGRRTAGGLDHRRRRLRGRGGGACQLAPGGRRRGGLRKGKGGSRKGGTGQAGGAKCRTVERGGIREKKSPARGGAFKGRDLPGLIHRRRPETGLIDRRMRQAGAAAPPATV